MAETFPELTEKLAAFIRRQPLFFVATAPSAPDGHVNVSPKGLDTLRILEPTTVAYLDLTGSGIETVSHLRDNGRICVMFCSFEGATQILRLHGRGEVLEAGTPEFAELYGLFEPRDHARSIVRIAVERITTSCGYGVPLMEFRRQRETLDRYWASERNDPIEYRKEMNAESIDGLPGLRHEPVPP